MYYEPTEITTSKSDRRITCSQRHDYTNPEGYLWIQAPAYHHKAIFCGDLLPFRDRMHSAAGFAPIPQFALYRNTTNTTDARIVNLIEVCKIMQGCELMEIGRQIAEARAMGDNARKARLKRECLPYITHTGIFIPRENKGLIQPGFSFQLDIDSIQNAPEILEKVIADNQLYVLFASVSVSGGGLKAMLFLKDLLYLRNSWSHEQYRESYHKVAEILYQYFKEKYGVAIDRQMKAISQPFYLFHSPDLYIHKSLRQWI